MVGAEAKSGTPRVLGPHLFWPQLKTEKLAWFWLWVSKRGSRGPGAALLKRILPLSSPTLFLSHCPLAGVPRRTQLCLQRHPLYAGIRIELDRVGTCSLSPQSGLCVGLLG